MDKNSEKLNLLAIRLENLLLKQQGFESEINALRQDISYLQNNGDVKSIHTLPPIQQTKINVDENQINTIEPIISPINVSPFQTETTNPSFATKFKKENFVKSDFEKFIGENLISKIGILILIIGVAIGAKYAIDKELLSPLTRIILGYLVGAGLMGFALKLKEKYESFSAVLLSGAIAIMYFLTYAAYNFYSLIPQQIAFGLMVIFTAFTVIAAIKYNKQVIAHIGLVGAYGVPFLLGDGSGQVVILFAYMAIINIGILILSFKKYWKPLFYLSFSVSWIIFTSWLLISYNNDIHFYLSLIFSSIFFITFYMTNLAYKVSKAEKFGITDVILLLLNSFIFYGLGFYILSENKNGLELLGLFTLINAIIHFLVSLVIYKRKLADKNLFYFILAMVITFITMAIPVQLNGNWVTIFWVIEALVLFYLGRNKGIIIYEKLAYPLIVLAFISILQDWRFSIIGFYNNSNYDPIIPFLNVNFLSAAIFITGFSLMFYISRKSIGADEKINPLRNIFSYIIPTFLVMVIYYAIRIEISLFFENAFYASKIIGKLPTNINEAIYNYNYINFKTTAIYIYSMLFAAALTFTNLKKIKSKELGFCNAMINLITILVFLTHGLLVLSDLRSAYILQNNQYFVSTNMNIMIRYMSIAALAVLMLSSYDLSKADFFKVRYTKIFNYVFYLSLLWVISSELLHLLELNGLRNGYKLGLSILWGVYALLLIGIGIAKNKKHLRIGAIVLFAITLIKLFIYDISSLDTISKTIVFVLLGVLLLIISFLYNKYKHLIIDDVKVED